MDFLQYYNLENYLFMTVRSRFTHGKRLSAFDFFCIVVWKANCAKSKIARRLLSGPPSGYHDLERAVDALARDLAKRQSPEDRLRCLCKEWKLSLPIASAILTVLYPDEFTVYDVRVCNMLNGFHNLKNLRRFENLWHGYEQYKVRVEAAAPENLSLRDKDRYLWAKSFFRQLRKDVSTGFR